MAARLFRNLAIRVVDWFAICFASRAAGTGVSRANLARDGLGGRRRGIGDGAVRFLGGRGVFALWGGRPDPCTRFRRHVARGHHFVHRRRAGGASMPGPFPRHAALTKKRHALTCSGVPVQAGTGVSSCASEAAISASLSSCSSRVNLCCRMAIRIWKEKEGNKKASRHGRLCDFEGEVRLSSRHKGHHHRVHARHMSDAIIDMRHHQRCAGVIERNTSSTVRVRVLM